MTDDNQQFEKSPWGDLRLVILLLAGLTLWLICFQYYTLDKFSAINQSLRYATSTLFLKAVRIYVPLNWIDGILAALILATTLALILLEILRSRITTFFCFIFETEQRTLWLLAMACLLLVRFYFARGGTSWVADTNNHLPYAWVAARSFAQGEIPIWTNYFATGSPFLQFYGFLFFYMVGAANLLFTDFFFSVKFVLAAGHVASGIGMYLFAKSLTGSRQAGFISGIAYVACFWHTQQVLMMGRLPLSLFYGLLPYPFYCFEQLRRSTNLLTVVTLGAVTLACLAFTHPGYAFWATGFLGIYILIRITSQSGDFPEKVRRHAAVLFLGGLVLASYHLLPMYVDREYTTLSKGLSFPGFPDPTWRHVLLWSNFRFRLFGEPQHFYGGYLGLSLILLSIAGSMAIAFNRPTRKLIGLAPFICLLGSSLLVIGHSWPILRSIPVVQAFNSGRYLLFVSFFLSLVAGVGSLYLLNAFGHKWKINRIFTCVLLITLADLGPTTFQHPYQESGFIHAAVPPALENGEFNTRLDEPVPNHRIVYTTNDHYPNHAIAWFLITTGMPHTLYIHPGHSLAGSAFSNPFSKEMNRFFANIKNANQLSSDRGFDLILTGFHLLNAHHILIPQSEFTESWYYNFRNVRPVVVSSRTTPWDFPVLELSESETQAAFRRMVRAMGFNAKDRTCQRILLLGGDQEEDLQTSPKANVTRHQVWNQRVELDLHVSADCFARLAYSYHPYLKVILNGEPITPMQTAGRFIALKLSEGEHRIVLEGTLSPLRKGLLVMDLCLLLLATGVIQYRKMRGKAESQRL